MHLYDVITSIGGYWAFVALPIQIHITKKSININTDISIGLSLVIDANLEFKVDNGLKIFQDISVECMECLNKDA